MANIFDMKMGYQNDLKMGYQNDLKTRVHHTVNMFDKGTVYTYVTVSPHPINHKRPPS